MQSRFQIRLIYMGFNAQDGGLHKFNYFKSATAGITKLDIDSSNTGEAAVLVTFMVRLVSVWSW